jgi:hypothetical protein
VRLRKVFGRADADQDRCPRRILHHGLQLAGADQNGLAAGGEAIGRLGDQCEFIDGLRPQRRCGGDQRHKRELEQAT